MVARMPEYSIFFMINPLQVRTVQNYSCAGIAKHSSARDGKSKVKASMCQLNKLYTRSPSFKKSCQLFLTEFTSRMMYGIEDMKK